MQLIEIEERRSIADEAFINSCSLSIMESAMVWELLLVTRKCIVVSQKCRDCAQNNDLSNVIGQRLGFLEQQITSLEELLKHSGLPLPVSSPNDGQKIIFWDDCSIILELLQEISKRIGALSFIMRSRLSSRSLRLVAAQFMADEMEQLASFCYLASLQEYCTS